MSAPHVAIVLLTALSVLTALKALSDGRPGLPHARAAVHALGSRRQTEAASPALGRAEECGP